MAARMVLAITCLALLASCGPDLAEVHALAVPCDGWTSDTPRTERDFALAASAEKFGRECANAKLSAIGELTSPRIMGK